MSKSRAGIVLNRVAGVGGGILTIMSVADLPQQWKTWMGWIAEYSDHIRWGMAAVGLLLIAVATRKGWRDWFSAAPKQPPADAKPKGAALTIEYDPRLHLANRGAFTEARFLVGNTGDRPATHVKVKLKSLLALSNRESSQAFANQFGAHLLGGTSEGHEFSLAPGEFEEVIVLRAAKGDSAIEIVGYSREKVPAKYMVPRADYELTVAATSDDATPATRQFRLTPLPAGDVSFATIAPSA